MSTTQDIFKIAILSPDDKTYEILNNEESILGYEFARSYTQTQGAAFAFSHFNIDYQRLTAQFWLMDGHPQWTTVRNLYLKKTSGMVLLLDATVKNWKETANRLIMEFVTVNRYSTPILILTPNEKSNHLKLISKFMEDIVRWCGYDVEILNISSKDNAEAVLNDFMTKVKNWRAKTVTFQTMKLYFSFDCITRSSRSISAIIKHMRKIFISRYIRLVDDNYLSRIIIDAAKVQGFNATDTEIIYERVRREEPHEFLLPISVDEELKKPNVSKI
ncbi:MAG: hypothetical protein INQ03_02410 [Candidatus Heimdallarchaeota archaeon]|nr:hypothetical protein [Candidatus Heimdallarchaeota archaeon]